MFKGVTLEITYDSSAIVVPLSLATFCQPTGERESHTTLPAVNESNRVI
jgi:hypothetical protein